MSIFNKIFGDPNDKYIKSLQPLVDKINSLEKDLEKLSDDELRGKTDEFKKRLSDGESLDDLLTEAFASIREASKRTLGQRHFDVQLIGGIVLHQGRITEMKTGEGKTLVATLPAYLNALIGEGIHLVTVNDYLARRDTAWMGQIYNALGMTVGCINNDQSYIYDEQHRHEIQNDNSKLKNEDEHDKERDTLGSFKVVHEFLKPSPKKESYDADITYGTNNEYGFDYLRDNMAQDKSQMVQRGGYTFAIVDEVDSILIDEARTPLIISAPDEDSTKLYGTFSKIVPSLVENKDYNVDEKLKAVSITEDGIEKVEKALGVKNIYDEGGTKYVHHMEQALKATVLFKKDKDYVVKDGEIIIVDEFTGRLMPGRRWSQGLHQAVEAKENVGVQKESRTLATVTFQNYFRLYKKLSGMTGTAQTSSEEFDRVYHIETTVIPTNKPLIRKDMPDVIYKTEAGKIKAVANEIKRISETGQPVLVGTVSIEKNEFLSAMLNREGVQHNILNAKQHEREAEILAQAGRYGAVTIATNMAGRGVDILLGGNPRDEDQFKKVCDAGGLHVIGTERHEARRIDDQLRGRAGRQGDPGSTQFFVSTEDEVIRIFGGDKLKNLMNTLGVGEDDAIENRFISRAIQQAQSKIEGHNFDTRKYVLEYDDVMNKHRESIYGTRRKVLHSDNNKDLVWGYIEDLTKNLIKFHTQGDDDQWNLKEIGETVKALTGKEFRIENLESRNREKINDDTLEFIKNAYEEREKEVGEENMRRLEGILLLKVLDEIWMDHIEAMDYLRDSVRLRAYGQRDPLIEYKIEGQKMFEKLGNAIKAQVANLIFKVNFTNQPLKKVVGEERRPEAGRTFDNKHVTSDNRANSVKGQSPNVNSQPKIGRNDPCFCGSGKKYKKCHGK